MVTNEPSSSRVRAVAQVGSASPHEQSAAERITPRRQPGHIGVVSVGQLLAVEAVLVLVVVASGGRQWMLIAAAIITLCMVVITFGRRHGRWWTEIILLRWRYRHRPHAGGGDAVDPRLAAVNELVPNLRVTTVVDSGGSQVGVGRDGSGWFAVVAVSPSGGLRGDIPISLPLDELARIAQDSEMSGTVVQVVTHTLPAPTSEMSNQSACTLSYRDLAAGGDQSLVMPADQITWIAVRLGIEAVADWADPTEAATVTANLIGRAGRIMKRAGLTYRVLDSDALLDALVCSCSLESTESDRRPKSVEHWSSWHSGNLDHVSFWVRDWPPLASTETLLRTLSCCPATLTNIAITMEPREQSVDLRCLVRVGAPTVLLPAACDAIQRAAGKLGATLFRLDGEHGPATYASAPSGGGGR